MEVLWRQAKAMVEYLLIAAAYGLCVGVAVGRPVGVLAGFFVLALVLLCKGMQRDALDAQPLT